MNYGVWRVSETDAGKLPCRAQSTNCGGANGGDGWGTGCGWLYHVDTPRFAWLLRHVTYRVSS